MIIGGGFFNYDRTPIKQRCIKPENSQTPHFARSFFAQTAALLTELRIKKIKKFGDFNFLTVFTVVKPFEDCLPVVLWRFSFKKISIQFIFQYRFTTTVEIKSHLQRVNRRVGTQPTVITKG